MGGGGGNLKGKTIPKPKEEFTNFQ